jgi:hypothetical protein
MAEIIKKRKVGDSIVLTLPKEIAENAKDVSHYSVSVDERGVVTYKPV